MINLEKAKKKWDHVLENMGVLDTDRKDWMSEYAEYHSIKENAYANLGNFNGMQGVANPTVAANPGNALGVANFNRTYNADGNSGSGDYGQQLLPVAMKIAAQTIGLDLVSVKPTPGPKIDLMYIDFAYDDNTNETNERPQVSIVDFGANSADVQSFLDGLATEVGAVQRQGGLTERVYARLLAGGTSDPFGPSATDSKLSWVEFLGYSRINKKPMFRIFRQANVASATSGAAWGFDDDKNTFTADQVMSDEFAKGFADSTLGTTFSGVTGSVSIELVSALEDHIPAFSANFTSDKYGQTREQEETLYPGIIAPRVQSKTIQTGEIEVSTALKRTEIEDIKASLGIDIVQKMESILVNELSQTISKQIISKLFEMGNLNRQSAPDYNGTNANAPSTVFDFDVDDYLSNGGLGGETSHAVQRRLVTKILHASNYLATEGRVGPAQFVVTSGRLAAALADIAGYTLNPVKSKVNAAGQLYPMGTIGDVQIYVDPYMSYSDNRMLVGRKNNPDQPGIVFVPYLMAQSISLLSEATFAPRMLLRSRYAIAELGFYPQKQYMTVVVKDTKHILA